MEHLQQWNVFYVIKIYQQNFEFDFKMLLLSTVFNGMQRLGINRRTTEKARSLPHHMF